MDDWEDWDSDNYCLPNEGQLKQLEERKLVEESDNALTKHLFEDDLVYQKVNKYQAKTNVSIAEKQLHKKNLISKQKENEQKQKEFSKSVKEYKAKKEREKELFGEAIENEYTKFEEMFY
jgi:hypothetical protein